MGLFRKPFRQHVVDRFVESPPLSYGVNFLDDALRGLHKRSVVLIGARTGVGKTQLAATIALRAAQAHKTVRYFCLEAEKHEIEKRLLYQEVARAYYALPHHQRPLTNKLNWPDWYYGKFHKDELIISLEQVAWQKLAIDTIDLEFVYRDGSFGVADLEAHIESAKTHCQLFIVDHLHYFDWSPRSSEYENLKTAVKAIRDLALQHEVPIILIAHLRKSDRNSKSCIPDLDDFHGSSDISKIATDAILLGRGKSTSKTRRTTYISIAKSRVCGDAVGFVGCLDFDLSKGCYEEKYVLAKNKFGEPEALDSAEVPAWAKHVDLG